MPKKKQNQPSAAVQPKYEFGFLEREIPTFFINNAQFGTGEGEMRIDLGEIQSVTTDGDNAPLISVLPKARVYLSLPFALKFMVALQRQITIQQEQMAAALEQMKATMARQAEMAREATARAAMARQQSEK